MMIQQVVLEINAHKNRIYDCFCYKGRAYTAGDNAIKIWDMTDLCGEHMRTCAHDTGPLTICREVDSYMVTGSANGALREWSLPHNVKKMEFRSSMWEHNGIINGVGYWTKASIRHLFSVSDDRSCRVWDLDVHQCIATIEPKDRTSGTLRSVATSDEFLFLGSSNGQIYAYMLERECRRPDRHVCRLPAGPVPYCPQTKFQHGDHVIGALEVGGFHHADDLLFSGSWDGSVWVWAIPEEGLEFEILYKFEDGHTLAVNCLCSSWAHLVTGGDDGVLNIYNLYSFDWSKCREKRLEVNGRVRCISLADEDDIEQDVAFLFVGTNKGELSVIRLGGYI